MVTIFQQAFARLLSEIEGDKNALSKNANVLIKYATTRDSQGNKVMVDLVPENTWSWRAYDEQIGINNYKTRCAWFLRRLATYAFSMDNIKRMQGDSALNLQVEFSSGNPKDTPHACIMNNGKVVAIGSYAHLNKAPCERLSCSCVWVTKVDFSKPITSSGYISNIKPTI